jgi:toxin ParE1/3/4
MASVLRTAAARLDYLEIFLYVAERDSRAADELVQSFDEALELIAQVPGTGRARPELRKDLWSFPVGKYLLFYRPIPEGIELIRVLHGARDLRKILAAK